MWPATLLVSLSVACAGSQNVSGATASRDPKPIKVGEDLEVRPLGKGVWLHRSWIDLPATAIKYIRRIEELIGAPVALLSTSPEREDTILVHDPFAT